MFCTLLRARVIFAALFSLTCTATLCLAPDLSWATADVLVLAPVSSTIAPVIAIKAVINASILIFMSVAFLSGLVVLHVASKRVWPWPRVRLADPRPGTVIGP